MVRNAVLAVAFLAGPLPASAQAPAGQAAQPSAAPTAQDAESWDFLMSQYPPRARAAGEQGMVGFTVTLDRDGFGKACEVTHSSGYRSLDDETCRLVLNHARFRNAEAARGRVGDTVHEGVVNWRLADAPPAVPLAEPLAVTAANAPDKMVCKRTTRIGSLVAKERVCRTTSEWQRLSERIRSEWGALQGTKGSTRGQ